MTGAPTSMLPTALKIGLASAVVAAAATAQTAPPGQGQNPPGGVVEWPPRSRSTVADQMQQPYQSMLQRMLSQRTGFPGLQVTTPEFHGFPMYTPGSGGFGGYPGMPGYTPPEKLPSDFAPVLGALRPPGLWPSWLAPRGADDRTPARVDRALLVRSSDRVWYRAADEPAYVPLPFFDKVRELEAGAGIQVRTTSGALTMWFHDGASLRADGEIHLEARTLTEAVAELDLKDMRRVWLRAVKRPMRFHLPDGSVFEVAGTQAYVAREGERVTVRNYGPAIAKLTSPLATVDLARNQEVILLMSPVPDDRVSTSLVLQGTVQARTEGRALAVSGGIEGGVVDWLGARLELGANQDATIDALAGASFPEYRPDAKKPNGHGNTGAKAAPAAPDAGQRPPQEAPTRR